MVNDPKFPHGHPINGFMIEAKAVASPEAQVKYLQQVLHHKEERIKTLEMELKTLGLKQSLEEIRVERRLEALYEINKEMHLRASKSRVPVEALEWLERRKLPWWKRIFRRK